MLYRRPPSKYSQIHTQSQEIKYLQTRILQESKPVSQSHNEVLCTEEISTETRNMSVENLTHHKELGFKNLFTNLNFIRVLIMELLSVIGVWGILYILPSLSLERGSDDIISALTVTVTGVVELLFR